MRVTERAMLRYLERTGRIDLGKLKQEILSPKVVAAIKTGAASVQVNGMTFALGNNTVVTVWPGARRR